MGSSLHQCLEGAVSAVATDGSGIIERPGRKSVFVFRTIPGETVRVQTRRKISDGIQADLLQILKTSPHRVEMPCPHATVCGGCKWQHMAYSFQTSLKNSLLLKAFAQEKIDLPLKGVEPCPDLFFFRNRMDYVFDTDGRLGLKEPGRWWSVIDLSTCLLLSKKTAEILQRIRNWTRGTGLPFWNNKTYEGFFRYLVIREGKNTGQRLVLVTTSTPPDSVSTQKIMEELPTVLGDLATSVLWGVNPHITDLSIPETISPLAGKPYLEEEINGLRYRIAPGSFFQTNTRMAARLQQTVKEFCQPLEEKSIVDLYCGAGFLTCSLSGARRLVGVEIDPLAIEAAKENANLNGITAEFHAEKSEAYDWTSACPQTVILDPPRSGLHPDVIKTLRRVVPASIVYVSCNYQRCAQELPLLLDRYRLTKAHALDLFPHTPHVELVLLLERM